VTYNTKIIQIICSSKNLKTTQFIGFAWFWCLLLPSLVTLPGFKPNLRILELEGVTANYAFRLTFYVSLILTLFMLY